MIAINANPLFTTQYIPYYGGKHQMIDYIFNKLPSNADIFVDAFTGSGVVALNSPIPTIIMNDLNPAIYNLHVTIQQENPFVLAERLEALPINAEMFNRQHAIMESTSTNSPMEKAIATLYVYNTSFNATGKQFANRNKESFSQSIGDNLIEAHKRLKTAQITNKPALEVIEQFKSNPRAVIYLDPPYLCSKRVAKRAYTYEWNTESEHTALLNSIIDANAKIILSGYQSELYDSILTQEAGWHSVVLCELVKSSSPKSNKPLAQEIVYMNYKGENVHG